ncbi:MAG: alanine racemase [Anaerorhabdus sp.]
MFLKKKCRCWAEINLNNVKINYHNIKKLVGDTKIMAVVKADAYGHGDVAVSKLLQEEGVDLFAVSTIEEALRLRNSQIKQDILILSYTPEEYFDYLKEYNIIQTVMSLEYADKLNEFAIKNNCKIRTHIKIDTGMSRIGIPYVLDNEQFDDIVAVYQLKNLSNEGIFSHFSVADTFFDKSDANFTDMQIQRFDEVLEKLSELKINYGITHLQNSYGILNYPHLKYDYCRPGIILFGSTSNDEIPLRVPFKLYPALEWFANVSQVKIVKKGGFVSYGRNYRAKEDIKVATIACGYADGLPRNLSLKGFQVLVNGVLCDIIGNICMDQCLVDVTKVKDVKEKDVVVIVGKQDGHSLTIDQLSRCANTINNESYCLISKRVLRFYELEETKLT